MGIARAVDSLTAGDRALQDPAGSCGGWSPGGVGEVPRVEHTAACLQLAAFV